METFSTVGLPSSGTGRTAAWNALYATQMSRVGFLPANQNQFDAELRIARLGPIKLARLSVENCSVERSQHDIMHSAPRMYNFLLQARGKSVFQHCGHESPLSEGDFVLCDTAQPHRWHTLERSTTIMVRVEPAVLREHLPTPEQFCGLRLGRAVGLTDTVGAMVRSLTDQVDPRDCAGYESRVARYLLDMLSMSYTKGFENDSPRSAIVCQRRHDIIRYVEDNLRDPELCPAMIATGLRLSPRYLRKIFSLSGERVSAYILRRRLDECARQMRDPAWTGHTLTEIAFSWGFNSAAHFARSFHEQFGMAPRDYRASSRDSAPPLLGELPAEARRISRQ